MLRRLGVVGVLVMVLVTAGLTAGCGSAESRFAAHMSRGQAYFTAGDYAKAGIEFRNALQIDPKSAAALIMTGKVAEKLQNPRAAAGLFQAAVDADSDNAEARADLGRVLVLGGAADQALKVLEPALRAHPEDPVLLTLRAAAREQLGNQAGAVADADRALRLAPTNVETIEVRAGLDRHAGNLAAALALVSGAVARAPTSTELHEALVDLYSAAGEPAKAESELHTLIDLMPHEPRYRYELAGFYVHQQRLDDAQQALEQGVKALPQDNNLKLALVDFISAQRTRAQGEQLLRSFIAREPDNYDLRLGLGALLERAGAVKEATDTYEQIVRRDATGPKGLIARDRLARMAWAQGRTEDAAKLIAQVLEQNPRDNDALVLHGQIALAHANPSAAITDLRAVVRDQPQAARPRQLLADALVLNGQPALAEEELRAAIELDPGDNSLRVALARVLLGMQRADEAVTVLEEAAQQAPEDAAVREQLAITYLARRDFDKARAAADDLARVAPTAAAGPYLAGLAAEGQKEPDEAERQLRRALALRPQSYDGLSTLARLQVSRGEVAAAVALVKNAVDHDPADPHKLNLLGEMYLAQRNFPLASDALTRAAAAAPNWWVPFRNLAIAKLATRDMTAVVAAYQNSIKAGPSAVQPLSELGLFYQTHGRADDAIALYEDWHRRNPQVQSAADYLAMLLVTYRHDQSSLDRARDLTARFSTSSDGTQLDTSGWVHFKRAEYPQALTLLQRAAQALPDSREVRYHLAMAELRSGNPDRARKDLETALSGAASFFGAADARATLASLKTPTG
jgi:tetratricopeptide (TPR) repeat protein